MVAVRLPAAASRPSGRLGPSSEQMHVMCGALATARRPRQSTNLQRNRELALSEISPLARATRHARLQAVTIGKPIYCSDTTAAEELMVEQLQADR